MAIQGAADVTVTVVPPIAPDNQQGQASPSPSDHGNSFVRSIDRKARSYLKTLERSFSFSMGESRDDDQSSMTIEFLRMRLQAQRAEYKAEKQKAQQLARKVLELQQRLNSEIERRRNAEHNDTPVSSTKYRSRLRSFRSFNDRFGHTILDSESRENFPQQEHPDCFPEISETEDDVLLISPPSLQCPSEVPDQGHQQVAYSQNKLLQSQDINEASLIKDRIPNDEESRNKSLIGAPKCEMFSPHLGPKGSKGANASDDMHPQPSETVSACINSSLRHKEHHIHEEPCTKEGMAHHKINHLVKPVHSCQTCQENHISHSWTPLEAEERTEFGMTEKPMLFKDPHSRSSGGGPDIFSHSNTNKDELEEGPAIKQATCNEYVKAILPLDILKTLDNYEISLLRLSPQRLPHPSRKASPNLSPLQKSHRYQYHMSLDGGMDRLHDNAE